MLKQKMPGELVKFTTKDGLVLEGFLHHSAKKNRRAIIHVHGMIGTFYKPPFLWELSKELKDTGYDLFMFNNRGTGLETRFTSKGRRKDIGTAHEKFEECILDIDAAIKTMQELGYKEFFLSGHSTGCQKITYYQAKKQNKKVKALLLLAPADDYNEARKKLGKKFQTAVKTAKQMDRQGKGPEIVPKWVSTYSGIEAFSAKRFLSVADSKSTEAQVYNYHGRMANFSKIKEPMFAVFGSKEAHKEISPRKMLKILREKTNSELLITCEIKGAKHSFYGNEKELVKGIKNFIVKL